MFISKTRFINWTRCPMYFSMDLKYNPTGKDDIDAERERREESLEELKDGVTSYDSFEGEEEEFDSQPGPELEALLPYYNRVEEEALKVAKKYFQGTFVADSKDVHNQKLFEYKHNEHVYRCYVDIYNENDDEINIIEVKATTSSKYCFTEKVRRGRPDRKGLFFSNKAPRARNATYYPLFVEQDNVWRFNTAQSMVTEEAKSNFEKKKTDLLNRYDVGKYPHDLAFQRFVIEHALQKAGVERRVNYYLAVLNKDYVYDGSVDEDGACIYNNNGGQEIVTFFDMNETTKSYQPLILEEVAKLEGYISKRHDINDKVPVGKWCAWEKNTECVFCKHCFRELRSVPEKNAAYNYVNFRFFTNPDDSIQYDKYRLINSSYFNLDDVPETWLNNVNHKIQRKCFNEESEYLNVKKMKYWFEEIVKDYPIYHLDFETFPCPLPRFVGEKPYSQSVFEFSLHVEREPGICDKEEDNFIFLNKENYDDERKALAKALVDQFEFNADGTLKGTMLAQNTTFEKQRLEELAQICPEYKEKLEAIRNKSADLIHLLKTSEDLYSAKFREEAKIINYYDNGLSGSYSIKKTLPVLVPSLTYDGMDVGNGVQAYITYLNYDSPASTFGTMNTKEERRAALNRYCQQDTWAMVEILRAVRKKIYGPESK